MSNNESRRIDAINFSNETSPKTHLSEEVMKLIREKTGIRPGMKGTCECPVCHDNLLHWEVSAFNGAIRAFCQGLNCVKWSE